MASIVLIVGAAIFLAVKQTSEIAAQPSNNEGEWGISVRQIPDTGIEFSFQCGSMSFKVGADNHDASTLYNASAGTYECVQDEGEGWTLRNIFCDDPDGGTTVDLESRRAVIDIDPNEAVRCIFTNSAEAGSAWPIEHQLGPCGAVTNIVWGFENQTKRWRSYAPAALAPFQTLRELESGGRYFLNAQTSCRISLGNNIVDLVPGWNLFGWRENGLEGGLLATFEAVGDIFRVWVTNAETIQQLFDLWEGRSSASIPNGRILRGPGQAGHNAPWSWHLDPKEIGMAEFTIELCDGNPSYVESELDYWGETVGFYCPWSAVLIDLQDFR